VSVAMSSAPSKPRRWQRSSSSRVIGCGNFGAGPKPPQLASKDRRSPSNASRSTASSGWPSPPAPGRVAWAAISSTSWAPWRRASSRRRSQASATASSTLLKLGMPGRSSLGK
jgi:hypothetical protein